MMLFQVSQARNHSVLSQVPYPVPSLATHNQLPKFFSNESTPVSFLYQCPLSNLTHSSNNPLLVNAQLECHYSESIISPIILVALLSHGNVCLGARALTDDRMELFVFVLKRGDHIDIYEISTELHTVRGLQIRYKSPAMYLLLGPSVVKVTRTN